MLETLIAAATITAAPEPAPLWHRLGDDPRAVYLLDKTSFHRRDGGAELVLIRAWRVPHPEGFRYEVVRMEIDCPARTFTVRDLRPYRADGVEVMTPPLAIQARPIDGNPAIGVLLPYACDGAALPAGGRQATAHQIALAVTAG